MKQLLQSLRTGETLVAEVPVPQLQPGSVLVRNRASVVSPGTERTLVEFAEKNLLQKAAARPDLTRQVLDKARRDGWLTTVQAALSRLDRPVPMGYSCAGTVIGVGEDVAEFQVGDCVACCGFGYASHSEVVCVPRMLAAKVPSDGKHPCVNLEQAAFATLGAIAMHGVRLGGVALGDVVVVLGLGLIGQLTVQLLKVAGCRVLAMDPVSSRATLAARAGTAAVCSASELHSALAQMAPQGADAVLITAGSADNTLITLAGELARDRGTVVAVGSVGLNIPRKLYYDKELAFRISRSYGPGRYDPEYEEHGNDYPIGYVRWTERRNLESVLNLMAAGELDIQSLISHRFEIQQAARAYELISGRTSEPFLGVLITYPEQNAPLSSTVNIASRVVSATPVRVGMLGAGAFATGTLLPAMKEAGVELISVCARTGATAAFAARKFGFVRATTSEAELLADPAVTMVVIATRHGRHGPQVEAALRAGKHVFCEKPLCLTREQLLAVCDAYHSANGAGLMVGFNRRFAPMMRLLKEFASAILEPMVMHYRVNAGYIPREHWVHHPREGGGRILGEVCHFVDQLMFLAGALPVAVRAHALPNNGRYSSDNVVVNLQFANESIATITYVANGDRGFSKERLEVFGGGAVGVLEDFRSLELVRGRRRIMRSRLKQDKGHLGEWQALKAAMSSGKPFPVPFHEIVASSLATMAILDSLRTGSEIEVDTSGFLSHFAASPLAADLAPGGCGQ